MKEGEEKLQKWEIKRIQQKRTKLLETKNKGGGNLLDKSICKHRRPEE